MFAEYFLQRSIGQVNDLVMELQRRQPEVTLQPFLQRISVVYNLFFNAGQMNILIPITSYKEFFWVLFVCSYYNYSIF